MQAVLAAVLEGRMTVPSLVLLIRMTPCELVERGEEATQATKPAIVFVGCCLAALTAKDSDIQDSHPASAYEGGT